jgi:hypothetical protein
MADGLFKGIGSAFNRYIGGLLGEDVEKMTPEERRAARAAAIGIIGRGMVSPDGGSQALTAVRASRQAARDEQEMRRRQAAAEAALPDISSRIFGGRTGTMIEDVEGGPATPLMARRAPTAAGAREAIGMMYGTQAGRDVATMAPGLMTAAQEQMKPGEFVYQNVPNVGLVAVSKTNPSDVRVVQRVGREPSAPAKPELRAVRLPNGMVQDMWIAPGQSSGTPVGAPYAPKGAEGDTLNARQRTGVSMTQDAAVNYAVNVTGLPKAEIEKMSPAQVEAAIIKRGGRVLQGGTARIVSGLPVIGDFASTFVAAANADLLGPAAQGAAGIANLQNPSGTITGADLTAAGTQFPNAMMPIETQAQMIRSLLEQSRQIEQYDANGNKVR